MLGILLIFTVLGTTYCQYRDEDQYKEQNREYYDRLRERDYYDAKEQRTHPQILSHKQSLNHDGNFKYAFASDNGLLQGESIAPDGSRTGAYAYVDPSGKKISVKYIAGKEGFKILEGDHIPKPPPHAAVETHPGYGGGVGGSEGRFRSESRPGPQEYRPKYTEPLYRGRQEGLWNSQIGKPSLSYSNEDLPRPQPRFLERPEERKESNEILPFKIADRYKSLDERDDPEYHDAPGKANSFGSGYSFEFGG